LSSDAPLFPDESEPASEPVAIPSAQLSAQALRGVIEAFVLREGTDYGVREVAFEAKVAQVAAQLAAGEAQIWFEPETSSVVILRKPDSGG
jgi:uncharacterized protein